MTMVTRKRFLQAAGSGTILLWLQACGGGGDGGGGSGLPAAGTCGSSGAAISGNHGHSLTIDKADLDSMTDMTYSIMGSATHDHTITLTVAQLGALKAGQAVTVTSSVVLAHDHSVMITCT